MSGWSGENLIVSLTQDRHVRRKLLEELTPNTAMWLGKDRDIIYKCDVTIFITVVTELSDSVHPNYLEFEDIVESF